MERLVMSNTGKTLLATINGMGFPCFRYPKAVPGQERRDQIVMPGYYYNEPLAQIEHWSLPAKWNAIMADHASNNKGLILDGFQSVLPFEDIEHMISSLNVWKSYMDKLGE